MSHLRVWIVNYPQTKLFTLNDLISINIRLSLLFHAHLSKNKTLIKNFIGMNLYKNRKKRK